MLKLLRNKKLQKKIWIALAIMILPAFLFWGLGSIMRSPESRNAPLKLNGRIISAAEFNDSYEAVKNSALIQFGDKFDEVSGYLNLESQAWDRILLLQEAQNKHLKASDKEVVELIQGYPFFQKNGKFDDSIYQAMLKYVFRTPARTFEEQTRQNIIMSKLYQQTTANIALSANEAKDEYRKANEEVNVTYISSLASDFTKDIRPKDPELLDYFKAHPLDFKQPLTYNLQYLIFEDSVKANDAFKRAQMQEDFSKIAKDTGAALKETGPFPQEGPIPGIGWSLDLLKQVTLLRVGQTAPLFRQDKYLYLLKMKEIKEAYTPEFDKIKEKIREDFIRNKSQELAQEKINSALLHVNKQDFNKTATFKYGSYIEGVGASDKLWLAVKDLNPGQFSGIISLPTGFYILKLKSRTPFDEKKFEAEKGEFSKGLLEQKKQEAFQKYLESLKKSTLKP
jgi:peptidyl-prolyl cis-trans isomerase D